MKLTLIFVTALSLSAAPIYTATATLTGVNGDSVDGSYTSPYYLTLGTQQLTVFCDDYLDHVSVGETWDAVVFSGSDTTGSYFPVNDYDSLFWLVDQALDHPESHVDIQQAIWYIESGYGVHNAWVTASQGQTVDRSRFIVIDGYGAPGDRPQEFIVRGDAVVNVVTPTPEPGCLVLIGLGMVGIAVKGRRGSE